jgi:ribosomal protein L4
LLKKFLMLSPIECSPVADVPVADVLVADVLVAEVPAVVAVPEALAVDELEAFR